VRGGVAGWCGAVLGWLVGGGGGGVVDGWGGGGGGGGTHLEGFGLLCLSRVYELARVVLDAAHHVARLACKKNKM